MSSKELPGQTGLQTGPHGSVYKCVCECICASVCCTYFICVCMCVWTCVCMGEGSGFPGLELSLQFRAGFPTEDLGTGLVRAPKGCQFHGGSPTLIKPTED